MSEKTTLVRSRLLNDGSVVRVLPDGSTRPVGETRTDWARVDAMTEEEVEANTLSDPDGTPETGLQTF